MIDQESEIHQWMIKMDKAKAISTERNKQSELNKQKHEENFYKWLEKSGPIPISDQNKEWEFNRPNSKYLQYYSIEWRKDTRFDPAKKNTKRFNRKHTNDLGSHHGESRNSRADKMSGHLNGGWLDDAKAGVKKFFKQFYTSKRRMFLKNERNWDKI